MNTDTPRTDLLFEKYEVDMDGVDLREGVSQLETELVEMRNALESYAGNRIDLTNAPCHRGITTAYKCGRCSKDLRAWAILEKTK